MRIRRYRPTDATALAEVFHRAVHDGSTAHYDALQRAAWSPAPDPVRFSDREANGRRVWVAEIAGKVTGFIELEPDGHIDCFYCHPRGAGSALYATLEEAAGQAQLRVEASDVARPFFERRGFQVITEQQVERHGVALRNTLMVKSSK